MAKKILINQQPIDQTPGLPSEQTLVSQNGLTKLFPVLGQKNYQLYFFGQLISLTGTWLQIVAQSWLVLQLTNSPLMIGVVGACSTAPSLLFSLFGGVIGDKYNKLTVLYYTQSISLVLAIILGLLTVTNVVTVWMICLIAFLMGMVNSVDGPTRQSFVVDMVGKKDLHSAISLNSGMFNGARVIGPSIAGFLIAAVGSGGAFIANGVSYLAVIWAMTKMNVKSVTHPVHANPLRAIQEGLQYTWSHPLIRLILAMVALTSIFGWSYTTILPYVAQHDYGLDATGLGYFFAASGLGAIAAVFIVSLWGKKYSPIYFIVGGNTLFCLALMMMTLTTNVYLGMVALFVCGLGLLCQFSTMNTVVQHLVEDQYRGRVMSVYSLMFMGLLPLGNLQVGYISEHFSSQVAIRISAAITLVGCLLISLWIKQRYNKLLRTH